MRRPSAVVLALTLIPAAGPRAGERLTREYDLKAAFLFNFAQFVEWPGGAFPSEDTPIIIGVLGDDPFGRSLDEMVANERVRDRKLVVRRFRHVKEIGLCHILFISRTQSADLESLREYLVGKRVLTVGETEDFTSHSGMIRFVMVGSRIRLAINVEAARAAGLTISSKLLRQVEIVGGEALR